MGAWEIESELRDRGKYWSCRGIWDLGCVLSWNKRDSECVIVIDVIDVMDEISLAH